MDKNFLNYRPAHIVKGKDNYYVAYSVTNPETGKLIVKRIKLNYIKSKRQQRQYAEELIKQINIKLARGFNPFLTEKTDKLVLMSEAVTDFLKTKRREVDTKAITNATFEDYKQQLNYFATYISKDCFLFKIKQAEVNGFLDDIYINKTLSAVTRNNYLQTLKTFFNYAVSRGFVSENPAKEIKPLKRGEKRRKAIPEDTIKQIFNYLRENGENFYLLACNLLFCCFIRPSEICGLKIKDLNFKKQTIFISADISKNKKSQIVTMPENVCMMLLDLEIYKYPSDFYIIGKDFTPSIEKLKSSLLRYKWDDLRKKLGFSQSYQFYSLKDSGITKMLNILDVSEVRDQARHSNIAITDTYTDRRTKDGNEHIKKLSFIPSV